MENNTRNHPSQKDPNQENPQAQNVVFVDFLSVKKAVENLRKSKEDFQQLLIQAELGDASSQYDLAVRYITGDGVKTNEAKAARWFQKSSDQGDLRALEAYARCLLTGSGVAQDEARAVELLEQGSAQDFPSAQCLSLIHI